MKEFCLTAVTLLACGVMAAGAEGRASEILFVHLRLENGRAVLVDQKRAPGVLKERRGAEPARSLHIELLSGTGATLWKTAIPDPSIRRLEYEDPDHPGKIKVHEAPVTNAEFTVRVPVHAQAQTLALSRRHPEKKPGASDREELGRVPLAKTAP